MNFIHIGLDNAVIKIIGIGNTASNAVTHMQTRSVKGVDFFSIDADQPINQQLEDSHLLFLVADTDEIKSIETGLLIVKRARKLNILTVAIISTNDSVDNLTELEQCTDSLIVISNKNRTQANELALDIVRGISDLNTQRGQIGFDFADTKSVLKDAGRSLVGVGVATGVTRAQDATEKALSCFNVIDLGSAGGVLVNISATDMDIAEFDEVGNIIYNLASENSTIKLGVTFDENLGHKIKVTIIATMLDDSIQT